MGIAIKNGHVIDPANNIDAVHDIYIVNDKIAALDNPPTDFICEKIIDATNLIVCPGLIDLSAHCREPGQEHKATIESETRAAAANGITTLCCPPDTNPIIDTPAVSTLIQDKANAAGYCQVYPLGAMTQQLAGKQLSEMSALKASGCIGISHTRAPLANNQILRHALEYAATHQLTVFLHSYDHSLANNGCMHEGNISTRLGLPGIPETAETVAIAKDLLLIEQTGAKAHFCQLSTAKACDMIATAQKNGLPVTADVAAYQLFLTDNDVNHFNSQFHVQPPLRSEDDKSALINAVKNNVISCITSHHQPHEAAAKLMPFAASTPGISGLDTLLSLCLTLVEQKVFTLSAMITHLTSEPAKIIGKEIGHLSPGSMANICIFDPKEQWVASTENWYSAGKNTPFMDTQLRGQVRYTLLHGKVIFPFIP